jgi:hypothetical protein
MAAEVKKSREKNHEKIKSACPKFYKAILKDYVLQTLELLQNNKSLSAFLREGYNHILLLSAKPS